MPEANILPLFKACPQVEFRGSEALLTRTGLNAQFRTITPIGDGRYFYYFFYTPDKKLKGVHLYGNKPCKPAEFDTVGKARYKQVLLYLIDLYGLPDVGKKLNLNSIPEAGGLIHLHLWSPKSTRPYSIQAGIINRPNEGGYAPMIELIQASGTAASGVAQDKSTLLTEWEDVEAYSYLKEADTHIKAATKALEKRDAKTATTEFKAAASLGSARGEWGLAFLVKDKKTEAAGRAENLRYSGMAGYVPSLQEIHKDANEALKKLRFTRESWEAVVKHIKTRADAGSMTDQYNLGLIYRLGVGMTPNPMDAKKYFEMAAAQGDVQAKTAAKK